MPGRADGVVFASFTAPVVNRRGDVAFRATISGPGIDTTNNDGIYLARRVVPPVAATAVPVQGAGQVAIEPLVVENPLGLSGLTITLDPSPLLTDLPTFAALVFGRLSGPEITTANDGVLLKCQPGIEPLILAQEGQLIGTTGFRIGPNALDPLASIRSLPIATADYDSDGTIDYIAFARPLTVVPEAGGIAVKGLVTLVEETLQLGPKVGDPMIGVDGVNFGSIGDAFTVGFVDGNSATFLGVSPLSDVQGIYSHSRNGETEPLLLEGKLAPGLKGFTLSLLSSPVASSGGGAFVYPGFAFKRRGDKIKELAGVFEFNPGSGKIKLVLPTGDSLIPGGPEGGRYGATFQALANAYLNRVIHTEVVGIEPVGEALVASQKGKRTTAFAFEGGPAAGFTDGSTLSEITNAFIDGGSVGWSGERFGTATTTQTVLYQTSLLGPAPLTSLLVAEGQPINFSPGGTRTISSLATPFGLSAIPGTARYFTSTGTAYLCNFVGGGSGICYSPRPDEQPARIQPDVIIKVGENVVGDDVHEPKDPEIQIGSFSVPAGTTGSFIIRLQNDSDDRYSIEFEMKAPTVDFSEAFARLYVDGSDPLMEINGTHRGGNSRFEYRTDVLQPGAFVDLRIDLPVPADFKKFYGNQSRRGKIKLKAIIDFGVVVATDTFDITLIIPP